MSVHSWFWCTHGFGVHVCALPGCKHQGSGGWFHSPLLHPRGRHALLIRHACHANAHANAHAPLRKQSSFFAEASPKSKGLLRRTNGSGWRRQRWTQLPHHCVQGRIRSLRADLRRHCIIKYAYLILSQLTTWTRGRQCRLPFRLVRTIRGPRHRIPRHPGAIEYWNR